MNPFVVGARVAVSHGYDRGYAEDRVAKVHKSGRFVLTKRSDLQWRPSENVTHDGRWRASGAGQNYGSLLFWNEAADPTIQRANAARDRIALFNDIRYRIDRLSSSDITIELLQAIKDILDCAEEKK